MRGRELLREATRNLATGTTRALTLSLVLLAILVVTIGMDQAGVLGTRLDHARFRAEGSTLWTLTSPGGIDAPRCEALAAVPGVVGAGATRAREDLRLAVLPSTTTRAMDASPGLRTILGIPTAGPGVWLSPNLSATTGADPGEHLVLTDGTTVPVAGAYTFPEALSWAALSTAVLTPTPSAGVWDECWADIEVHHDGNTAAMRYALTETTAGEQPQLTQLNTANGRSHNLATLLADRPTRWLLVGAPVLAALLGIAAVRARRLELAAARHVGVTRTDLAAQTALETTAWAGAATILTLALIGLGRVALLAGTGLDPRTGLTTTLLDAARPAALSATTAVAAATLTAAATSPHLLYRYFRER